MNDFRRLEDGIWASPQIDPAAIAEAARLGVTLVINNRPEGEAEDQTPGPVIESAAREAGIDYRAIPVDHSGFSMPQIEAMADALDGARGPVLAYCRSGTRSTLLWALAQACKGRAASEIAELARNAGYDVGPVRQGMEALAARAN